MHRFNTKLNAFFEGQMFSVSFIGQPWVLQLNEYQTDPYFLQFLQSNLTVCLTIYMFVIFSNASASLKLFCFDFCNKNNFWCNVVNSGQNLPPLARIRLGYIKFRFSKKATKFKTIFHMI